MARQRTWLKTEIGGLPVWGMIAAIALIIVMGTYALLSSSGTETQAWTRYTPPPTEAPLPVAMFIGDSYTHGTGATSEANRWSSLVSDAEGWQEMNIALGGTGYLTTAGVNGCGKDYCENYLEVVQNLDPDTSQPNVIFVSGGQNDFSAWAADPEAVTAAINQTFAELRAKYPDTRIVANGPSIIGDVNDNVRAFDAAVQEAAAAVGAEYISMIDPDVIDRSMDAGDGGHVNDSGHTAIAERVIQNLS